MNFSQLPKLWKAVQYMASCNGMQMIADAERVELPLDDDLLVEAERVAEQLDESALRAIVNPDLIDPNCADGEDDALETMADGERSIVDLILKTVPGAPKLDEVLADAFDGKISELLSANE